MSTNATTKPDHRALPRKKRPPSARDQEIYKERLTSGCTQAELAEKFGLKQPRVSQILTRVRNWRANLRPQEDGELSHDARQRLDRWEQRELHRAIFERAIRGFDRTPPKLTTVKEAERDGKKYHEETKRDIVAPAGLLRVAQRAAENLGQESDKPPPPGFKDPEWDARQEYCSLRTKLWQLRHQAEREGKVPASRSYRHDSFSHETLVNFWLAALLGQEDASLPWDVHLAEGESLGALLNFYHTQLARHRRDTEEFMAAERAKQDAAAAGSNLNSVHNANVTETPQVQSELDVTSPEAAENPDANIAPLAGTKPGPGIPAGAPAAAGPPASGGTGVSPVPGSAPASAPAPGLVPADPAVAALRADPFYQRALHKAAEQILKAEREAAEKAERRRLHMEKLERFYKAQRSGTSAMFEMFTFDPEDGPMPVMSHRW